MKPSTWSHLTKLITAGSPGKQLAGAHRSQAPGQSVVCGWGRVWFDLAESVVSNLCARQELVDPGGEPPTGGPPQF